MTIGLNKVHRLFYGFIGIEELHNSGLSTCLKVKFSYLRPLQLLIIWMHSNTMMQPLQNHFLNTIFLLLRFTVLL